MNKEKIYELLEASEHLPELPESVSQIIDILNNPVALDIDKLAEKLSSNGHLNELMIKNLNSGYFQLNRKINSIKEAIVYLGMKTVQNLLIFFITRQFFPDAPARKARTFDMVHYWKHIIGTSVASCILSSRLQAADKYKLFSYRLMHDIGIAVLDMYLPELIDEVSEKLKSGMHQLVAERTVMGGITHAEIGAWLCRKWNL